MKQRLITFAVFGSIFFTCIYHLHALFESSLKEKRDLKVIAGMKAKIADFQKAKADGIAAQAAPDPSRETKKPQTVLVPHASAPPPETGTKAPSKETHFLEAQPLPDRARIESTLQRLSRKNAEELFSEWANQWGPPVFDILALIAMDDRVKWVERSLAIHGAVRIGKAKAVPFLSSLLKNKYPGIRATAAAEFQEIEPPSDTQRLFPLLKDNALIVRESAVDTIIRTRPVGGSTALAAVLADSRNYAHDRPLGIIFKVAMALRRSSETKSETKTWLAGVCSLSEEQQRRIRLLSHGKWAECESDEN